MNKYTKILLLFMMSAVFLLPAQKSRAAIDGYATITYPKGGEVFTEGDMMTITWTTSPNIDKVTIGYSHGPGNLDWVAFTAPNTGSYTWKVDVGNQTNTQFLIDFTAWETGKGSINVQSNWFTVYQKDTYPPKPAAPTVVYGCTDRSATNYNSTATNDNGSCTFPAPAPTSIQPTQPAPPAPIQPVKNDSPNIIVNTVIQQTAVVSIVQIQSNNTYYFENSKTTDLKKVNPAKVDNFTLDRLDLLYLTFLGKTDLSSKTAAVAMRNLDDMVYMGDYYFSFKWEFWMLFKSSVRFSFYDKAKVLTADSPVKLNGNKLKADEYKIETQKDGNKDITITPAVINKYAVAGDKIEISMEPAPQANPASTTAQSAVEYKKKIPMAFFVGLGVVVVITVLVGFFVLKSNK